MYLDLPGSPGWQTSTFGSVTTGGGFGTHFSYDIKKIKNAISLSHALYCRWAIPALDVHYARGIL